MLKKTIFTLAFAALAIFSANAREISIFGKATFLGDNKPAPYVNIRNEATNEVLGSTDDEGNYSIVADSEATLLFESFTVEDLLVEVNGRMQLNVTLNRAKKTLEEVEVVAKGSKKTMVFDDMELEIDGNMLKIRGYRVHINKKLLNNDRRLIIQPAVCNVSRNNEISFLSPVVIDGKNYAATQERMYDWHLSLDTLTQSANYYVMKGDTLKDNVVIIRDSLYLEDPTNDVYAVIHPMIEDYNRVVYADSFEVAHGVRNPFRFLKFELDPVDGVEKIHIPNDMPEPRDTDGEMNLIFEVGKSKLDPSLGINGSELESLLVQLQNSNNQNSTLKGFSIFGYASPEGNPETNARLSKERMQSALKWINANYKFPKQVKPEYQSEVAPWSEVIDMLRTDSLFEEADRMQQVLDDYKSAEGRSVAMARLPFYKSILAEKYLPRLRRVSYNIKTEYYRPLTDAEIAEIYQQDPSQLQKHHYYRYFNSKEGQEREEILKNAVKYYPKNFPAAATALSKIMLEKKQDPTSILAPYFDPKEYRSWRTLLPSSMIHNYGITAMNTKRYNLADSLYSLLPDNLPEVHKAKNYCRIIMGDFSDDVVNEVGQESPLNRVLIYLKQNRNGIAWQAAQKLGNSAIENYIKAIAAHRVEDWSDQDLLETALRMDPALIETAKVDGDVIDMLENLDLDDIIANPIIEEDFTVEPEDAENAENSETSDDTDNSETPDNANESAI